MPPNETVLKPTIEVTAADADHPFYCWWVIKRAEQEAFCEMMNPIIAQVEAIIVAVHALSTARNQATLSPINTEEVTT